MENKIAISVWEYENFVKAQEKVRILERMLEISGYVSGDDIKAVLGVKDKAVTTAAKVVEEVKE